MHCFRCYVVVYRCGVSLLPLPNDSKTDVRFQTGSESLQLFLTTCLCGMSIWLTVPLSSSVSYLYAGVFTAVTFVAPGVLVWAQRYKK